MGADSHWKNANARSEQGGSSTPSFWDTLRHKHTPLQRFGNGGVGLARNRQQRNAATSDGVLRRSDWGLAVVQGR